MEHQQLSSSPVPPSDTNPEPKVSIAFSGRPFREDLCQFPFSDGRACRMPIAKNHTYLCLFHARHEHQLLAADQVPGRLASPSGHFKTASDINHVLGQLFRLVAENRIPRHDALSLAYIAQLILQSLPHVRTEIKETLGDDMWLFTMQDALCPKWPEDESPKSQSPADSRQETPPISEETATTEANSQDENSSGVSPDP